MTPEEMIQVSRPIAEALLPTTATPREKALLTAEVAIILDKNPEIITTIWDPYKCPVGLLPYLAWALSVDVYNDDWSEARKRDVIAASPIVHRRKGTLYAVERSVAALGVEVDVLEWHLQEPVGRRGTFIVESRYQDTDISDVRIETAYIEQAVNRTKPKSRVPEYKHIIRRTAPIRVGAIHRFGGKIAVTNIATEDQSNQNPQVVGIATRNSGSIVVRNEV